jgi:signal transduction histidine kinase/streptogramin lyase
LWAGTRVGAIHCLIPGIGWREITPKRSRTLGGISCFYEDNEGLIWAGTVAGNLHQIKPRLFNLLSLPTVTQENVPQTVCVTHDGTLWVGTDGNGIYRFKDDVFSKFEITAQASNATVMAIFEDRDNQLWFGTLSGLYRLENGRLKPQLESIIQGQPVPALFQDRDGALWFGTIGAVIRKDGDNVKTYPLGNPGHDKEVRAIVAGRNEMWIGTRSGGLFRIHKDKMEHSAKFQRPAVESLYRDGDGALWIGSLARGLYRMKGGNLRYWSRTDGFPSSWVHSIIEDSNGILWLSSNDGIFGVAKNALLANKRGGTPLSLIHVAASEVENWSVGSGQPSASQSPDGRLWFPVGHGVLSFNPKELLRKRPSLPVLVEAVKIDDAEQSFSETKPLEVYTGMKRVEFQYTIADLDSPGRLKFRYQLEGQDEQFVDGSAQRNAPYGALLPGTYRFRVTCSGSANELIEIANPLTLIVKPHYYETHWFQASAGFFVICMVGGTAQFIGRAKLRRKLERLEMQQAMEKERRRIAQDLHDDLGSGITEIMLLSELAKTGKSVPPTEMRSQLDDITEKARQVATAMDEIVWTVNPKNDSLPDLASYLADHAREFLRAANVSCRIDMMEDLPAIPVHAQQRHNLFLGVKEALNNAAKHSRATEVWLRISWRDHRLTVVVEDNGRGFTDETERGNGLGNILARMEAIHGRAEISTEPEKGSRISFILPLAGQKPSLA